MKKRDTCVVSYFDYKRFISVWLQFLNSFSEEKICPEISGCKPINKLGTT